MVTFDTPGLVGAGIGAMIIQPVPRLLILLPLSPLLFPLLLSSVTQDSLSLLEALVWWLR